MQTTINYAERRDNLLARRIREMSKRKRLESMKKRHGVHFFGRKFFYEELK